MRASGRVVFADAIEDVAAVSLDCSAWKLL